MKVLKSIHGDTAVLTLDGEFDSFVTNPFTAEIQKVRDEGFGKIVLNMSRVGFVNSTAMGAMIRARKACKAAGGDVVVSQPSPAVREAMESLGLERLFTIHEDDDAAVAAMASSASVELSGDTESTVMIHPPGDARTIVARLRKLDAEELDCRVPGGSAELVHGREMRLKFRLKHYRKEWFDLKARIETVHEDGEVTTVTFRLTKVSDEDRQAIQRFVDDMNDLRDAARGGD